MDDTDDISRARKLGRVINAMPLPKADKAVLAQSLALFIDSYHHGYRIVNQAPPRESDRSGHFGDLGSMARGL